MYTARIPLILVGVLISGLVGCGKRCGQPLAETPTSITQYEWRLAQSTDSKVQNSLTRFNFLIFKFTASGSMSVGAGMNGLMKKVINNTAQDDKAATPFNYVIDPNYPKFVCMDFNPGSSVNTSAGLEANCRALLGGAAPASQTIYLYQYELNRWGLKLTQVGNNSTQAPIMYDFRAYTGAVNPDDFCEF